MVVEISANSAASKSLSVTFWNPGDTMMTWIGWPSNIKGQDAAFKVFAVLSENLAQQNGDPFNGAHLTRVSVEVHLGFGGLVLCRLLLGHAHVAPSRSGVPGLPHKLDGFDPM